MHDDFRLLHRLLYALIIQHVPFDQRKVGMSSERFFAQRIAFKRIKHDNLIIFDEGFNNR